MNAGAPALAGGPGAAGVSRGAGGQCQPRPPDLIPAPTTPTPKCHRKQKIPSPSGGGLGRGRPPNYPADDAHSSFDKLRMNAGAPALAGGPGAAGVSRGAGGQCQPRPPDLIPAPTTPTPKCHRKQKIPSPSGGGLGWGRPPIQPGCRASASISPARCSAKAAMSSQCRCPASDTAPK